MVNRIKVFDMLSSEVVIVSLEELVSQEHQYRKFKSLFNFKTVEKQLMLVESQAHYKGYGVLRLFKCLLLQFMEDLSDRELERYLSDSNAAKWFCDFSLREKTPDYSVFSRLRSKIGTERLSKIFALFRDQLREQGYISEVFTFVDASHLIAKASFGKNGMRLEKRNTKSLTIRYCQKWHMISKPKFAVKVVVNFGMDIKTICVLICNLA